MRIKVILYHKIADMQQVIVARQKMVMIDATKNNIFLLPEFYIFRSFILLNFLFKNT